MNDPAPIGGEGNSLFLRSLLNTPHFVLPARAAELYHFLAGRFGAPEALNAPEFEQSAFVGSRRRDDGSFSAVRSTAGIGIIPIVGTLVNRGSWLDANSGMVSYEGIEFQLQQAAEDNELHTVILDMNSPGGEVSGFQRVTKAVRNLRSQKRVIAYLNDMAASAGYGIAAQADEIVISETSIVGSIGTVMLHVDKSEHLKALGMAPTFVYAGHHKIDGNPLQPLSKEVRSDIQVNVDKMYEIFLQTVSAGRGSRTTVDAARATQARVYIGQDAIDAGLADRVADLSEILSERTAARSADRRQPGETSMKTPSGAPAASNPAGNDDSQAALDASFAAGATAERARIKSILDLDEAKGREATAMATALNSDVNAEGARAILGASPKAEAPVTSIEERNNEAESGLGFSPNAGPEPKADASWDKTVNKLNSRLAK